MCLSGAFVRRIHTLGAGLQGLVHLFKAFSRVPVKSVPEERHQESAERFTLPENDLPIRDRPDLEAVCAIEQAGQQKAAPPS